MRGEISRRKLAQYVVDHADHGVVPEAVIKEVAAYLIESDRRREITLLIRAVEDAFEEAGVVAATVTTARKLDDALRTQIIQLIGGTEVYIRQIVDSSVLGGVKIDTPSASVDLTVKRKLTLLANAGR